MRAEDNPPKLVAAGAGSGKTYRIVEAVVDRVRAGTPVDRIAAVTFTDAAAAELQDRVRARLLSLGLLAEAARVDAADICTIHRFALTLLQRYPLAAGLPPQPLVLDDQGARVLLRRMLSDALRDEGAPALRALLEDSLGPGVGLAARGRSDDQTPTGRLQALVREVLEKCRSVAMRPEAVRAEGERAAERLVGCLGPAGDALALDAAVTSGLDAAWRHLDANPEPLRKTDQGMYAALRSLREDRGVLPVDAALRLSREDTSKGLARDLAGLLAAVEAASTTHPELRRRLTDGVRGVFAVASGVLEGYTAEKARLGAVDFEDMQLMALDLLEGRGAGGAPATPYAPLVARALPFVVVDEFQDTSPLQFRLFEALREAGCEVRYVGDLKQGIYGFRTADSALFAALLDRARARGETVESLDRSRRSRPELVAFANGLFGAVMPPSGLAFAPLVAENDYAIGRCPKDTPSVDLVRFPSPNQNAPKIRAGVARLMALVAEGTPVLDRTSRAPRPARYGDVAVLAYDKYTLANWSAALRARGVATVHEGESLFDALEVQLAHAWLQMLASPRDRAAAAAVLLSELYGVSQRTMVRLTLAKVSGSPERALEVHRDTPGALPLDPFEVRALMRAADDLAAGRRALRQLPLPEAVEQALESIGLAERLSLRCDGPGAAQVRANVGALVALAHALARRGDPALTLAGATGATLENLLLDLERAARDELRQPVALEDTPDAVRLVTLHKSKGMEYPVVFLDVLSRKLEVRLPRVEVVRPGEGEALLHPDALGASGVQIVPDVGVGAVALRLRGAFDGDLRLRQEWLRLLYVAVTRARDHLAVMWPEDTKTGTAQYVRGLVTALLPAIPAAGLSTWLGVPVRVVAPPEDPTVTGTDDPPEPPDLTPWRALAEDDSEALPSVTARVPSLYVPRLARVSPSELCEVADCPEVPRLRRFLREEHRLARSTGEPVGLRAVPRAATERAAVPRELPPSRVGSLVHGAVERASLLGEGTAAGDLSLARAVLATRGVTEHADALAALAARTLVSLRAVVSLLGAVEEPARELPFALDLGGTTLQGAVDLVVRGADGLHVVDLKTHLLSVEDLPKWAAYYRPQLDAYALAVQRITGERVVGRHLAVPAAGALATLPTVPGGFDAEAAETYLVALAGRMARGDRGPGQDCAACRWRPDCRVGRAVLASRGASAEAVP